jgi:murein DD-endopeptidase MepM/ murein hydrolase activator NlpD
MPQKVRARFAILIVGSVLFALFQPGAAGEDQPTSELQEALQRETSNPTIAASPIEGLKAPELRDSFQEVHNGHHHEAIDIIEPNGTPVRAVVDGTIGKLFFSERGGNAIYEFDEASAYCYYYAHLDHYADGLHEGMHVSQGTVIGYVGSTGDASLAAPHLHFAIYQLDPDKRWWKGTPIDPYPTLIRLLKNVPPAP